MLSSERRIRMIIDDEFLEKLKVGDEIKIKVVETEEPYQCNRCIFMIGGKCLHRMTLSIQRTATK